MQLTEQQHRAIYTHDKNLIVVAGAGSGKTHILVERYLALLAANPDWPLNALVAITFTEKAAQEMRDRVRTKLSERLNQSSGEMAVRWSSLLAQMDSARIGTIHSLCATILRANAAEAGVDPAFEVLDEVNAAILLDSVVDDVLDSLVFTGDPALRLFTEYDTKAIRDVLRRSDLLSKDVPEPEADLMPLWETLYWQSASEEIEILLSDEGFRIAISWEPPDGWPDDDKIAHGWFFAQEQTEKLFREIDVQVRMDAIRALKSIQMRGGSAKNWGGAEIFAEAKDYLKIVRSQAENCLKSIGELPGDLDGRAAVLIPLWVSLIRRVQAAYRKAKDEAGVLDFDDLESRTKALFAEHAHVQERYQGLEFRHLLVDEFQDTNAAQWVIIQSLAALETGGSLFVVGDPKQSIYAFRGADVSVFGSVHDQITQADGERVALSMSFRTHAPLIAQFNALFDRILVKNPSSPVASYEVTNEVMTAFRPDAPGDISVELLLYDTSIQTPDGKTVSAEIGRQWEAYTLAHKIHAMVEQGVLVYDKAEQITRPMRYDDVALLFQAMSNVTLYEDVFKALGLPFVTIAGRGYYSRQEVWDVLNLLKALHNPADNLSLATALRSPMFNFSDDLLYALRMLADENGQVLSLWQALFHVCDTDDSHPGIEPGDRALVFRAWSILKQLHDIAGRVPIADLLRRMLSITGYLAVLTGMPDGARRRGNVEKLVQLAETSGKITLGAFSRYLDDLSGREVREGEVRLDAAGAVTLMTVHASKGLEYPVVILADASWTMRGGSSDPVILDERYGLTCRVYDSEQEKLVGTYAYERANRLQQLREDAERKRLLYVAATRAQDYLIVSGQIKKDNKTSGWLSQLTDALGIFNQPDELEAGVLQWEGGALRVSIQSELPDLDRLSDNTDGQSTWSLPAVQQGQPVPDFSSVEPTLLRKIPVLPGSSASHLSATQIADLGGMHHALKPTDQAFYRDRFRRKVLHDSPSRVDRIYMPGKNRVTRRKLGEILHEVLRYWYFPAHEREMNDMLRGYAWQQGLTHENDLWEAVQETRKLLRAFQTSELFGRIQAARDAAMSFYPELPFIYDTGKRIIHGIVDLLFQEQSGNWVLVDYKTSYVENGARDSQAVKIHAKRYHLQVGTYAAAVREQFRALRGESVVPDVFIHYIRHNQTVQVDREVWQAELLQLEDRIGELIRDE